MASRPSKGVRHWWVLAAVALLGGAALRVTDLAARPMHCDEAVHALKLGALLEGQGYRYDPHEYHGPTLNFLTAPLAWLRGQRDTVTLDETTVRLLPALVGVGGIALVLVLLWPISPRAAALGALLTAFSPMLVYYSRYYIQETLLVTFTTGLLACLARYRRQPHWGWAAGVGVAAGLMHATKETALLAWTALLVAVVLTWWPSRRRLAIHAGHLRHALVALLAASVVGPLFFSSFGAHPAGLADAWGFWPAYLARGAGASVHRHPWYAYAHWLLAWKLGTGPLFSEVFLVAAGLAGVVAVVRGRGQPPPDVVSAVPDRFTPCWLAWYVLLLGGIYTVLPYKTPWSFLGVVQGLAILGGLGLAAVRPRRQHSLARSAYTIVVAAGIAHLAVQAYAASFAYAASPANPWVYAHPTRDVFDIVDRVEAIADVHPDGAALTIQVYAPESDYWPLPWYLRRHPNIGWYAELDAAPPVAPVILAPGAWRDALVARSYVARPPGQRFLYVPMFKMKRYLRPGLPFGGLVQWRWYERAFEGGRSYEPGHATSRRN